MNKLISAVAVLAALSTSVVQADSPEPTFADYNKALLSIGVDPVSAAVAAQIALTKVYDMKLASQRQHRASATK